MFTEKITWYGQKTLSNFQNVAYVMIGPGDTAWFSYDYFSILLYHMVRIPNTALEIITSSVMEMKNGQRSSVVVIAPRIQSLVCEAHVQDLCQTN